MLLQMFQIFHVLFTIKIDKWEKSRVLFSPQTFQNITFQSRNCNTLNPYYFCLRVSYRQNLLLAHVYTYMQYYNYNIISSRTLLHPHCIALVMHSAYWK